MKLVNIGDLGIRVDPDELRTIRDIDGYINDIVLMVIDPVVRQNKSDLVVSPEDLISYLETLKKPVKKAIKPKKQESALLQEYRATIDQLVATVKKLQASETHLQPPTELSEDVLMVELNKVYEPFIKQFADDNISYYDVINFLLAKALFGKEAKGFINRLLSSDVFDKLDSKF